MQGAWSQIRILPRVWGQTEFIHFALVIEDLTEEGILWTIGHTTAL